MESGCVCTERVPDAPGGRGHHTRRVPRASRCRAAEAEGVDESTTEGEVSALSSSSTHVGQVDTVPEEEVNEASAVPTSDVGSSEMDSSHRTERLTRAERE